MKHVKTLIAATLKQQTDPKCRECATSCQSACKTSCTVGNQVCQK
ncbi:MAG: six-cysteine ranthipeptide SCIFF [Methylocystaceae bacterium]